MVAMVTRASLKPGQVFVHRFDLSADAPSGRALVVVTLNHEVDFWTGEPFLVGAEFPFEKVEVL